MPANRSLIGEAELPCRRLRSGPPAPLTLPCIIADDEPDLIRCLPPRRDHGRTMRLLTHGRTMRLLTHDRVRHAPRVRTVIDFLYERLKQRVDELNLAV